MNGHGLVLQIDSDGEIPRFQQLIDQIHRAITDGSLQPGELLPSVNLICEQTCLARGTIVKAYEELKRRGLVISVKNKGYYVARTNLRVMLLLDTFRPFKHMIYDQLRAQLPEGAEVNLYFHHYNLALMEEIILSTSFRYSVYIIMAFDDPGIGALLSKLPADRLLVFDWYNEHWGDFARLTQDFEKSFYQSLERIAVRLITYDEFQFVCPASTNHPLVAHDVFNRFCRNHEIDGRITLKPEYSEKSSAFLVVDDRHLIEVVKYGRSHGLRFGKEIGVISYNDYPMKEVLEGGITVISADSSHIAGRMAHFIHSREKIREMVEAGLILRKSI